MVILILIFGFLNLPAAEGEKPEDVDGWGAVRWGMTEAQVLRAYKGAARRSPKPVTYPDGARASVEMPEAEIGGLRWDVQFVFSGRLRGLDQLIFGDPDERRMPAHDMLELYGRVLSQLTTRYGKPYEIHISPPERPGRFALWKFPSTMIILSAAGDKGLYGFHVEVFKRKGCKWEFCKDN